MLSCCFLSLVAVFKFHNGSRNLHLVAYKSHTNSSTVSDVNISLAHSLLVLVNITGMQTLVIKAGGNAGLGYKME